MQMNILATSANPQTCARNLDTTTVEEQILVVGCLLSRYASDCTFRINDLYKYTTSNHPFLRWLWNDEANVDWLKEYGVLLNCEYSARVGKSHAASHHIYDFIEDFRPPVGLEPKAFMNRAWDDTFDFRHIKDPHQAYRDLMNARWFNSKRKLSWGDRMPPVWYIEHQIARSVPERPRIKGMKIVKEGILEDGTPYTVTESA